MQFFNDYLPMGKYIADMNFALCVNQQTFQRLGDDK